MKKNFHKKNLVVLKKSSLKEESRLFQKAVLCLPYFRSSLKLAIYLNPRFDLKACLCLFNFHKFKRQCLLTWRSRSVYSFFDLSRMALRELSSFGNLKGIKKSSW